MFNNAAEQVNYSIKEADIMLGIPNYTTYKYKF